jgi:predicted TPR repeat methyltransferase
MNTANASQPENLDYDQMAHAHYWHPEALFGLVYEYLRPGDRLLDAGIGTGLASQTFAKAGVQVFGFDADQAMLAICRAKEFAVDLRQHDLLDTPWPYAAQRFDHILACGVLHFLAEPAPVFGEVSRLLRPGGTFTFTSKAPAASLEGAPAHGQAAEETIQGERLYLHARASLDRLMAASGLALLKELRLVVKTGRASDDLFFAFVTRLTSAGA